jgi:hypothetical protein
MPLMTSTQGQSQRYCASIGFLFGTTSELLCNHSGCTTQAKAALMTIFKTKLNPALNADIYPVLLINEGVRTKTVKMTKENTVYLGCL